MNNLRLILRKYFTINKVLIGLVVITAFFMYRSDTIMFKLIDKIDSLFVSQAGFNGIGESRDSIMNFTDNFSISLFKTEYENLPRLNIQIKNKSMQKLTEIVEKGKKYTDVVYLQNLSMEEEDGNDYSKDTKIKFIFEGEEYKSKIKIHGTNYPHYINEKRSYAIKLSKDKLFKNMREFSLIIPDEQDMGGPFGYYLAKKYLSFNTQSFLTLVSLNGVDQGVYILEEKLKKELLEKNNLSGVDKIKPFDIWTTQYSGSPHIQPYSHKIPYLKINNYSKKENGQLLNYKKLYEAKTYESLAPYINIDKFARFEALRILVGGSHMVQGDNFRILYDNSTGRFSPYFRTEGYIESIKNSQFSKTFEHNLMNFPVFKVLSKSNEFRQLRNGYLFQLYKDKNVLKKEFSLLKENYIKVISSDSSNNYSRRRYISYSNTQENNLIQNLEYIYKYINYSRAYVTIIENGSDDFLLTIDPDSNVKLLIDEISSVDINGNVKVKIENLETKRSQSTTFNKLKDFLNKDNFILNVGDDLEAAKNPKNYKLTFEKSQNMANSKFYFKNSVSQELAKSKNIFIRHVKKPVKFYSHDEDYSKIFEKYNISLIDKTYTFKEGRYLITDDLVFPYGYALSIEAGSTIELAPGKSILVYGNVDINGTKEYPVKIINSTKNQPFGVFAAIGDGESFININYLEIYGGNEDSINGAFLSGQLSLYHHKKIILRNSFIHHGSSDDGLNIKNSDILIESNIFNANFADQVDLDFCTGIVSKNKFLSKEFREYFNSIKLKEDNNGDGLDFSGSKIKVVDNIFDNFLDKGISVGENTQAVIYKNNFTNNRSAITSKDESDVYVYSNNYKNNRFNIEMYQKKKIFDYPSLYNVDEEHYKSKINKEKGSHYYKRGDTSPINFNESFEKVIYNLRAMAWVEYE